MGTEACMEEESQNVISKYKKKKVRNLYYLIMNFDQQFQTFKKRKNYGKR